MDKALVLLQYGMIGLVRGCSNSIANGLELLQSCTQPSRYPFATHHVLRSARSWWRHQMETFSALPALCAANSPVTGEFLSQRPVPRSFDVFFDLHPNTQLSKESWGWWLETPSRPLWLHCIVPWRWFFSFNHFEISHRTRQCVCRTLCEIIKKNHWETEINGMHEPYFAGIEFKISFGGINYIVTTSAHMISYISEEDVTTVFTNYDDFHISWSLFYYNFTQIVSSNASGRF